MSMKPKRYPYKGKLYSLNELYAFFPDVKPTLLANRLKKGMTVVEAIAPQSWEEYIPEKYRSLLSVLIKHCEECRDRSDYCPIADAVRERYGAVLGGDECQNVFNQLKGECLRNGQRDQ